MIPKLKKSIALVCRACQVKSIDIKDQKTKIENKKKIKKIKLKLNKITTLFSERHPGLRLLTVQWPSKRSACPTYRRANWQASTSGMKGTKFWCRKERKVAGRRQLFSMIVSACSRGGGLSCSLRWGGRRRAGASLPDIWEMIYGKWDIIYLWDIMIFPLIYGKRYKSLI